MEHFDQGLFRLHGAPAARGVMKAGWEDFRVEEDLGFAPDGEGEHVLVRVRKSGCNTPFVADALAKFAGLPARAVSYAGLKDRQAVTEQWFCLHMPGKATPDFTAFHLNGCQVLESARHRRKLRIGTLRGNRFALILRDIDDPEAVERRLPLLGQQGVPNYFGPQRFGRQGNNLVQAQAWARDEIRIKDRAKRSFTLSAARSALFNAVVSERLARFGRWHLLEGDALQRVGRGSWFLASAPELPQLRERLRRGELVPTAPLPGIGKPGATACAELFERQCLSRQPELLSLLIRERVEADRRAMLVTPGDFRWYWRDTATLELHFDLPAGCFATSVVRELLELPPEP
ncbi:tRNA pseudouridine(13) synthase TruD [Martelella alba]|uniref:tRNA pseudouridine synthase D n=1 Tax=Martelella alba TaxID=2590451 RepID=A0ABY2SSI9_9HYPH|nr:tRNA pseudouridine(13) synthase TruD [Martelella alba]TKI08844.1 tRNA pseudouridine(13) synthase TruD [Martelella alba]